MPDNSGSSVRGAVLFRSTYPIGQTATLQHDNEGAKT